MPTPLDYHSPRRPEAQASQPADDRGHQSLLLGIGCPLVCAATVAIAFAEGGPAGACLFLLVGICALVLAPFGVWLAYTDRRVRGETRTITRWGFWLNLIVSGVLFGYVIFIFVRL